MNSSENNNFKFFKRNPIEFLAGIYIYLIVIVIIVGLIYVNNLNDITTHTVPPRLNAKVVVEDLKLQEAKEIPPADVLALIDPTPEIIAKGKTLFEQSCSSCHGNTGKGDGPAGEALIPKPRNFTNASGWKNGMKITEIYKTLEEGIPGSGMASYNYFLPDDNLALAAYIRSAFIKNAPEDTDEDLLNLDMTYNLSEGSSLPAQIPVKYAAKIISNEQAATQNKVNEILSSIDKMNDNEWKVLFSSVTYNKLSAVVMLNSDKSWKKDQKLFVDMIVNDVYTNGFNGNVFQLSSTEWNGLFQFLNEQIQ